jgi:capsular polysaccharide biosynthesis protein
MFIVLCIFISAIQLALDSPLLNPDSHEKWVLSIIDLTTIVIFTLEVGVKIIAYGFLFNGKKSYLRGIWN